MIRYDIDDSDLRDVHMRAFKRGGWVKYAEVERLQAAADMPCVELDDGGYWVTEDDWLALRATLRALAEKKP